MLESMEALIREHGMLPRGCTVLCAVSGGADSICLLHALYHLRPRLGFSLAAAHYNHQLRGEEADRDARFVEQFVSECCGPDRLPDGQVLPAVPLFSGSGDVASQAALLGMGIEETARDMRYAFLRQAAREAGATLIATAHTADDNSETILFHLARGSGLRGLTGIAPVRGDLIRPLLSTQRREIEEYLRYYGLPWREDSSNADDAYARNRIRHQVVPVLEDLFPGFSARLAGCAARLRADEVLLEEQANVLSSQAQVLPQGLSLPARLIADAPAPVAVRAVRQLIGTLNGDDQDCGAAHLESLVRLCRSEDPSARLSLPYGLAARREYDLLVLTRDTTPQVLEPVPLALPGETQAPPFLVRCFPAVYAGQRQGPFDFWLDARPGEAVTLRPRRTGDRLRLWGRPEKTLKKWFIDEKIPQSRRDCLPVLDWDGQVAAAAGLGPDAAFLPREGQAAWHIIITPLLTRSAGDGTELSSGKEAESC